ATTARSRKFFAKVFQERGAPAVTGFGVMNHVAQLLLRDALLVFVLLFNKTPLLHYVARAEKEHAIAGQTVSPGPPRFLIITLDVLRQIVMNNETDIRFVDPHSEGDRCRDHVCIVAQKLLLMFCPIRRL